MVDRHKLGIKCKNRGILFSLNKWRIAISADGYVNSMKLVILFHSMYWSIHTKDESKRGTAFAFIFGVN